MVSELLVSLSGSRECGYHRLANFKMRMNGIWPSPISRPHSHINIGIWACDLGFSVHETSFSRQDFQQHCYSDQPQDPGKGHVRENQECKSKTQRQQHWHHHRRHAVPKWVSHKDGSGCEIGSREQSKRSERLWMGVWLGKSNAFHHSEGLRPFSKCFLKQVGANPWPLAS